MIERVVIRGFCRTEVDNLISASVYDEGKVFPAWDTDPSANAGWFVYQFKILYPAERAAIQEVEGALYFSRLVDFETWFNAG